MNSLPLPPLAFGLGGQELMIVAVIVLVLFGGKKIPELMRGVGKGVGELQKGLDEGKKGFSGMMDSHDEPAPVAPVTPVATTPRAETHTTPPTA
ncbi:twin-arginine translocase TatA/TatE family subunit [bacterium]|nr:MAG: twin-arginine translocase TatA/TatE family subunit [bacterium]